ncbi:hypothetical protein [Actinomadura bangladeshensis]|uniref:Uncharacterized protein n=1 Tax=Actinomadura bangladeshensis TaxID=453573 RepID=A0A4R4NW50_9ACTN|nr:hypothetical protein [Actinomadura bangladeshensis]TDC12287.1 hypothetical protein E1284_24360 [Actinomadura bangladeshensis]
MDASTITAVSATLIAILSLLVSLQESRAIRRHNRESIRPLLRLKVSRKQGGRTGVVLVNCGLGSAIISRSVVTLDGDAIGEWNEAVVNGFREGLDPVPGASTFTTGYALPAGDERYLLELNDFDVSLHGDFWNLIRRRLGLEIFYESLYGGEEFSVALPVPPVRLPDGSQVYPSS